MENSTGRIIFSYDSLKASIRFLEFEKRNQLIKSVQSIRKISKLIPFHFESVSIENPNRQAIYIISLNSIKLAVIYSDARVINLTPKFDKIYYVPREIIREWSENFRKYFFGRPGTVINNLQILETCRYFFPVKAGIFNCKVRVETPHLMVKGVMDTLKSCAYGEMYIYGNRPERHINTSKLEWKKSMQVTVDWCPVNTFHECVKNLYFTSPTFNSFYRAELLSRVEYNRVLELVRKTFRCAKEKLLSMECCEMDGNVIKFCVTIRVSDALELNIWKGKDFTEARIMARGTAQYTREELMANQHKKCLKDQVSKFLRLPEAKKQMLNIWEIVCLMFLFVLFKIFDKNNRFVVKLVDQ